MLLNNQQNTFTFLFDYHHHRTTRSLTSSVSPRCANVDAHADEVYVQNIKFRGESNARMLVVFDPDRDWDANVYLCVLLCVLE